MVDLHLRNLQSVVEDGSAIIIQPIRNVTLVFDFLQKALNGINDTKLYLDINEHDLEEII